MAYRFIKHIQSQIQTGIIRKLPLRDDASGKIIRHGWIELHWRETPHPRSGLNILLKASSSDSEGDSGILWNDDLKGWISIAGSQTVDGNGKILKENQKVEFLMCPAITLNHDTYQPLMIALCVAPKMRRISTRRDNSGKARHIFSKHEPCGTFITYATRPQS